MGDLISPDQIGAWLSANGDALLMWGGGALALVVTVLGVVAAKRGHVDRVSVLVATSLVLAFSAEGMFEVARERLGLPVKLAALLFIVAEAAMVAAATRAHKHWKRLGVLGPNGRMVWWIAIPAGVIVGLNGKSLVEVLLRFGLPLLAAGLWWMGYQPDEPPGDSNGPGARRAKSGRWRWTPRRIGVHLGLIDPTDADLNQVHAERLTRRMVSLDRKRSNGASWLRGRRTARLEKLSELATPEMVAEAALRRQRSRNIVSLMAADPRKPDPVDQNGDLADRAGDRSPDGGRPRPRRALEPTEEQDRAAARALYLESLRTAMPISEARLGEQFGRGRSWGRARIQEARGEVATGEFPIIRDAEPEQAR